MTMERLQFHIADTQRKKIKLKNCTNSTVEVKMSKGMLEEKSHCLGRK